MTDPYQGREQALAKHSVLKHYLQALAYKILTVWDEIAYVDGFSGPWESRTSDFSDTSFGIAIQVLREAQSAFRVKGHAKTIRCILVENNPSAYEKLEKAALAHNDEAARFFVTPKLGEFEGSIPAISRFIGSAFALIFIDPMGWTGYSFSKISPLLRGRSSETLINFMYEFVNRAVHMDDPQTIASLDPILGGHGWKARLDTNLPPGQAVEKMFRDELKKAGSFKYVASTRVDRPTIDRPIYFLVYGTHSDAGLVAFRDAEWSSRRTYEQKRTSAKLAKREQETGTADLFGASGPHATETLRRFVEQEEIIAMRRVIEMLQASRGQMAFSQIRNLILESHMLRETDVKNICVALASQGIIRPTWAIARRKKPIAGDLISLA